MQEGVSRFNDWCGGCPHKTFWQILVGTITTFIGLVVFIWCIKHWKCKDTGSQKTEVIKRRGWIY